MKYTVQIVTYEECEKSIRSVRETVFVDEQQVPMDLEIDGLDPQCYHVLAEDEKNRPIGTGRMQKDGHIGRVAVLKSHRGRGVGLLMMEKMIRLAGELKLSKVYLNSQTDATPFYEKLGFTSSGEIFYEAGIPHIRMNLNL